VGAKVEGRIVSLTNYGAFVELEPGVEGLVHVSEMSWTRRVRHPSKLVNVGDPVEVMVLEVNKATKRISLGMKQVESDPWATIQERYQPGMRVQGKVRNLTDFGAFVELEPGVDGLLHISQMSNRPITTPADILNVGDELTLMVIRVDPNERRIGLSLKELAAVLEEPVQTEGRGRHKGRKRRGGDDYDDEE
jgi:small subunit ribosomal protein S1